MINVFRIRRILRVGVSSSFLRDERFQRQFCRGEEDSGFLLVLSRTDLRADLIDECDHRGYARGGFPGRRLDNQLQQRFTQDLAVDLNGMLLLSDFAGELFQVDRAFWPASLVA